MIRKLVLTATFFLFTGTSLVSAGAETVLGSSVAGVVTEVNCTTSRVEECVITTSENHRFRARTTYTNVVEIGAQLLLIVVGKNNDGYLCNVKGGSCAMIISETDQNPSR